MTASFYHCDVSSTNHYRRILAVVDSDADEHPAVKRAAALARAAGAHLDLLICTYNDHIAGTRFGDSEQLRQSRERMIGAAREKLELLAAPLRANGLEVGVHAVFGHPAHNSIIAESAELQSDIIVKDTHFHNMLNRTIFSNTDWELIRLCPINLMLVKTGRWSEPPVILVAVDPLHIGDKPAALDHEIMTQAVALTEMVEGQLKVVHCYPVSVPAAVAGAGLAVPAAVDAESLRSSVEKSHRIALDELLRDYNLAPDAVYLMPGEPGRQLVAMARGQKADLMVVGAVSRSWLKKAFLGFTALQILDRLACDLLIVKRQAT